MDYLKFHHIRINRIEKLLHGDPQSIRKVSQRNSLNVPLCLLCGTLCNCQSLFCFNVSCSNKLKF
jgi:hypothetical protein